MPRPEPEPQQKSRPASAPAGSPESARRLFAMSQPILGTRAETYLRKRGIAALHGTGALRFHPHCYYRPDRHSPTETWPAMIASVTDLDGRITGVHRTWLAPDGSGKAPVETPRRAIGDLLGNGVRFRIAHDVMAAGEGIETMLSLRMVLPTMPSVAALSAAHLAAILFPATLRRLYIVRDEDPAGEGAMQSLIERTQSVGIEAMTLSPRLGDFTRISARSTSMHFGPLCGFRSHRKMSPATWRGPHWSRCEDSRGRCAVSTTGRSSTSERAATTAF